MTHGWYVMAFGQLMHNQTVAYLIKNIICFFKSFLGMPQQEVGNLYVMERQRLEDSIMRLLLSQNICLNETRALGMLLLKIDQC